MTIKHNYLIPVSYGDYSGKPPKAVGNAVDSPQQKFARESRLAGEQG